MVNGFIFLCVYVHAFVCACVFICLCAHKKPQRTPSSHMSQPPPLFAALSGLDLLHTHTPLPQLLDGDHKSKASSLLAAKKTHGCFSPTKRGNKVCLTGSNTVEWSPLHGKNSSHKPTRDSVSVLATDIYGIHPIKSVGTHLFNTTARTALGSLPTVYCVKFFFFLC